MVTHGTCSPPCSRLPSEDERPNSFYLLVPDRVGVWLLRQLVQCEPDRTLNGGARLLLRLPFGDCKLVLQLLQKLPSHLLDRRFLGLGQLRFWLSKQIEYVAVRARRPRLGHAPNRRSQRYWKRLERVKGIEPSYSAWKGFDISFSQGISTSIRTSWPKHMKPATDEFGDPRKTSGARIQTSCSSIVLRITCIAFGCTRPTSVFGSVVRKALAGTGARSYQLA